MKSRDRGFISYYASVIFLDDEERAIDLFESEIEKDNNNIVAASHYLRCLVINYPSLVLKKIGIRSDGVVFPIGWEDCEDKEKIKIR